jgi:hypothetical protein
MTTLEEIISKAVPYFDYVFRVLSEKYRVEIRWEISTKMDTDYRLIGDEEKLIREIYELWIYIIGKTTVKVDGIIRYYVEIEKSKRREYIGFRLVSFEEIEDKIRRFL